MENVINTEITKIYADGGTEKREMNLLSEHELRVFVNEQPLLKLVCTKDHLKELVTGRLYTDGIINGTDEIDRLYFCRYENEVSVFLNHEAGLEEAIPSDLSCCTGNRVYRRAAGLRRTAVEAVYSYEPGWIFSLAEQFGKDTVIHKMTGGTHSCILARRGEFLFSCEDIGRHNAVDKAVGYALLNDVLPAECMLYTSGRVPLDMVQKVISAGIPILVTKSVPTAQSVSLAREAGLTLICRAGCESYTVMKMT